MGLISDRFTHIYMLDTEFVALPGEKQQPVSVCAKGFKQAKDVRVFLGQQSECLFVGVESDSTLFIGYNLAAEYKCFLSLGWPMPKHSIDLMYEFKNETCGVWRSRDNLWDLGCGLEDAVREMGGNPADFWHMN
jgi:hypothetical protein